MCVQVCHSGHEVRYAGKMEGFCDCGAKGDKSCDVLDEKAKEFYIGTYRKIQLKE